LRLDSPLDEELPKKFRYVRARLCFSVSQLSIRLMTTLGKSSIQMELSCSLFFSFQTTRSIKVKASLARRMRNAEAVLISALDRRKNGQRDLGRQYGPSQPTVIISGRPVLKPDGSRAEGSHSTPIN